MNTIDTENFLDILALNTKNGYLEYNSGHNSRNYNHANWHERKMSHKKKKAKHDNDDYYD